MMIKNYIKIAIRNLIRSKGYSFINIGGLALGMAVVILIGLWVLDDFTFNTYHKNHSQIGQIYHSGTSLKTSEVGVDPSTFHLFGSVLKEQYDDYFEYILRADWIKDHSVSYNGEISTKTGTFIESGALDMLSLQMVQGTHASLEELNSVVISESAAFAIFGSENPVGKQLKINSEMEAVVTGIYKDLPKNTRFWAVQFFANWNLFEANDPLFSWTKEVWDGWYFNLYVMLKPNVDFEEADRALQGFYAQYSPKDLAEGYEKRNLRPFVYPMDKWHLYSEFEQGLPTKGRITFIWLFIGIAIFVLLLACINFMNLSTARSEKRAKEVGIRKTVGSKKNQLIYQFLNESLLVAFIALLFALVLVILCLPWFNGLSGKVMHIPWNSLIFWGALLSFTTITGLLAGSYPAFYLSSFSPVKVLKGTFKTNRTTKISRKALVVFQFGISVVLAIGALIVYQQILFSKDRPIGYDRNDLIYLSTNNPDQAEKYDLLRTELLNSGAVVDMAQSRSPQIAIYNNGGGFDWPGKDPEQEDEFSLMPVTHDYGNTVGWELVDGRDFSREMATDSSAVIINEAAARYMGLENPVGTYITYGASEPIKIIGISKNMVMESPYNPVSQAIFYLSYANVPFIHIRLNTNMGTATAIQKVKKVFADIVPSTNFDYRFVNQDYDIKFKSEQRLGKLAGVFTLLAILISCLGLIGLASFVSEQRTKEIGIRKVLGDSVLNIWFMFSKDFAVLVLLSCLIAVPIAYHFMNGWLQNYKYHIDLSWHTFIPVILSALIIALLTVSFQAIRTARKKPIDALREE